MSSEKRAKTVRRYVMYVICISRAPGISHVLNEQGTGTELKNGARHLKEHPKVSKLAKFESYWFKRKGMVQFHKSLKRKKALFITFKQIRT